MSAKDLTRRSILKAVATGTVAVGVGVGLAGSAGAVGQAAAPSGGRNRLVPLNRIGIQLYSIRDQIESIGFRQVFETLSEIGYAQVEFAGFTQGSVGPITPAEIRVLLDDFGLTAAGAHAGPNPGNIDQLLETAHTLGMKHLGEGGMIWGGFSDTATTDQWLTACNTWNQMGVKAKAAGIKLYAHNHHFEFKPTADTGRRPYDIMWENLDFDTIAFEMDVYWAHVGAHLYPGFKPLDYILRDPRRFPLLHLKDGNGQPESEDLMGLVGGIAEFGAGNINYQAFLAATRDRGQRVGLWEQDTAATTPRPGFPVNSLGNAERSYDAIAALRG